MKRVMNAKIRMSFVTVIIFGVRVPIPIPIHIDWDDDVVWAVVISMLLVIVVLSVFGDRIEV
ncbi:hypothetical protein SCH4B_4387 [Ruegeria sp. TrichCH4B]|nr:hypothetical protein SCH4B_4387 [Ruegeria sp. TrichCH4B]